jgi:DNA-binding response OmpR family regulator
MSREDTRLHVLLVEDDPDMARLVSCQLGWSGSARFTVDLAPDLQSALSRIERDEFDAVLFDLSLPDGDPMSTLVVAGTLSRQLPILVLTGIEDEGMAELAARIGAQAYLLKGRGMDARILGREVYAAVHRHRWVRSA